MWLGQIYCGCRVILHKVSWLIKFLFFFLFFSFFYALLLSLTVFNVLNQKNLQKVWTPLLPERRTQQLRIKVFRTFFFQMLIIINILFFCIYFYCLFLAAISTRRRRTKAEATVSQRSDAEAAYDPRSCKKGKNLKKSDSSLGSKKSNRSGHQTR